MRSSPAPSSASGFGGRNSDQSPELQLDALQGAGCEKILTEKASGAGDNEARVGPLGASLDAGDDALDAAPALRAVEELLEAAYFAVSWRGLESRSTSTTRSTRFRELVKSG
jgi:hypothetical protein